MILLVFIFKLKVRLSFTKFLYNGEHTCCRPYHEDDVKTEVKFRHLCLYSRTYMKHHEHGQRHESQYHYRKMKYLHYLVSHTICVLF